MRISESLKSVMIQKKLCVIVFVVLAVCQGRLLGRSEIQIATEPSAGAIPLVAGHETVQILISRDDAKVVEIAAGMLADDIKAVTGKRPEIVRSPRDVTSKTVIIAGTHGKSRLIDGLIKSGKLDVSAIAGKWEACLVKSLHDPFPGVRQALLVVGSDRRGTAYGMMDISRAIGVSPWVWWADVKPEHKDALYFPAKTYIEPGPSVQYRGLFINDEDWSLIPWVRNTFDPKLGNIGPKTYQKIFELMLRLKANYLWPAMHHCSYQFNKFPENARLADDYAIVMGSSHCEPMLRNNVREWSEWKARHNEKGAKWNYFTNSQQIRSYWDDRLRTNGRYENVYTVGMRGIHDGSMPGGGSLQEKVRKLEEVFADQRKILAAGTGKIVTEIPQLFCPYKEVLRLYDAGLKVPDDVMICWAGDNQGYMRRLPNEDERRRRGGHGLYYHLSYWSDYLWLSTCSPQLMSYELTKAADYSASRLWVFNVGDIKICEKEIEFAMDLAWDTAAWSPAHADKWTEQWAAETFGKQFAKEIGSVLNEYYRLAYRGKPEHIGHISYSLPELKQRLNDYAAIAGRCEVLLNTMPPRLRDAFIHLVYYPVVACKYHNDKILLARLSLSGSAAEDTDQRQSLAGRSRAAWQKVKDLTVLYNSTAHGKWADLMSWHPRNLKVFYMPPTADNGNTARPVVLPDAPLKILTMRDIDSRGDGDAGYRLVQTSGLSIDGSAVYILPNLAPGISEDRMQTAPYIKFKTVLPKGEHTIRVKCLPSYPVNKGRKLRYAIAVNGESPAVYNAAHRETLHNHGSCTRTLTIITEPSVIGYTAGDHRVQIKKDGPVTIQIWILDPAVLIYRVECY